MQPNKTLLSTAITISLSSIISGCGQSPNSAYDKSYSGYESTASAEMFDESAEKMAVSPTSNPTQMEDGQSASHQLQSEVVSQTLADKKLLINVTAQFEVENVEASVAHIEKLTQQSKGYIARSRIDNNQYGGRQVVQGDTILNINRYVRIAEMTVRVPKDKVNSFLKSLQKEIQFLQFSEFTAEDVTLDIRRQQLKAQLSGQQAKELQEQRLKAKKADDQDSNVETINSTYEAKRQQALADIERQAIEDKLKYSTIQLSFSQPESLYQNTQQNIEQIIKDHEPSLGEQLQPRLLDGWLIFKQVILGVVQLWWLWLTLLFSVPVFMLVIRFWKWWAKKLFKNNLTKNIHEVTPDSFKDTNDNKGVLTKSATEESSSDDEDKQQPTS